MASSALGGRRPTHVVDQCRCPCCQVVERLFLLLFHEGSTNQLRARATPILQGAYTSYTQILEHAYLDPLRSEAPGEAGAPAGGAGPPGPPGGALPEATYGERPGGPTPRHRLGRRKRDPVKSSRVALQQLRTRHPQRRKQRTRQFLQQLGRLRLGLLWHV